MQPVVIEWNEFTSESKIYISDLLPILLRTHPMFSGVYGKIDHILNGTDHRALKKAHGIRDGRDRGSTELGIVADHGRIFAQFPIGFVNPHDHRSTFSDIGCGRLVNCQELAFYRLSPIQE
jgi:hypothetical protein